MFRCIENIMTGQITWSKSLYVTLSCTQGIDPIAGPIPHNAIFKYVDVQIVCVIKDLGHFPYQSAHGKGMSQACAINAHITVMGKSYATLIDDFFMAAHEGEGNYPSTKLTCPPTTNLQ